MKKLLTLSALSATLIALLTGCATKPMMNFDLNREVDISEFKTFALMPLPKRVKGARLDAVKHYGPASQVAIRESLIAHGYTEAASLEEADFALNVKAAVTPTLNVSQWGYTTGNYAGSDYWGTSSYYEVVADVDVRPDDHSIVVLEIYENKEKTLAWCAWMVDRTKRNRIPVEEFTDLLKGMLATFPAKQ